jgi:hypothetical protein
LDGRLSIAAGFSHGIRYEPVSGTHVEDGETQERLKA